MTEISETEPLNIFKELKCESEQRKFRVDPRVPFEFVHLAYQRAVTETHVNKLTRYLIDMEKKGEQPGFDKPMVVNIRSKGSVAMLDGYHRMAAIGRYGKPVDVKFEIYKGLTPVQEESIYHYYNISKVHTPLDILRPEIERSEALSHIRKYSRIPINLYNNRKVGMPLTTLLSSYKLQRGSFGHRNTLEFCKTLKFEEAQKICKWTRWYVDVVGEYSSSSLFYHKMFVSVIMYAYWNTLRLETLESRLRNFAFDAELRELLKTSGGFGTFPLVLRKVMEKLDKGLRNKILMADVINKASAEPTEGAE